MVEEVGRVILIDIFIDCYFIEEYISFFEISDIDIDIIFKLFFSVFIFKNKRKSKKVNLFVRMNY